MATAKYEMYGQDEADELTSIEIVLPAVDLVPEPPEPST